MKSRVEILLLTNADGHELRVEVQVASVSPEQHWSTVNITGCTVTSRRKSVHLRRPFVNMDLKLRAGVLRIKLGSTVKQVQRSMNLHLGSLDQNEQPWGGFLAGIDENGVENSKSSQKID